jgi:predicted RecB family nuclease
MAEIEPEYIGRHMKLAHDAVRQDRSWPVRALRQSSRCGSAHTCFFCSGCVDQNVARKSLTLVSVGPVITESPNASKQSVAVAVVQPPQFQRPRARQ